MAVPFSNTKLRVPQGFQNILECLAREVLCSQPDNIHEFAAAYFEKLLKVRSETGHDPAVHGALLEDRNYNNESFKKRDVDPSDPQQQTAATAIQSQYRQHSAKAQVADMREEQAATRIQAGFRGFLDREQVRDMKTKSEDGDGDGVAAEEEEVDIDLEDPEVEKAAIKIQAGFKGFKARKEVQEKTTTAQPQEDAQEESQKAQEEESQPPAQAAEEQQPATESGESGQAPADQGQQEEEVDIDLEDPATEKAALKIQAGFRGYQTRKEIGQKPAETADAEVKEDAPPAEEKQEEEIDIDLTDPEVEKAATKIQAGFKGFKTRKAAQEQKEQGQAEDQVDAVPETVAQETGAGAAAEDENAAPVVEQGGEEQEATTEEPPAAAEESKAEEPAAQTESVEEPAATEAAAPEGGD